MLVSTAQYEEDIVDVEVFVDAQSVGSRRLSYNFSSLRLARRLSTFYSRLMNVACHHQQQQRPSQREAGKMCGLEALDEALVKTMDDDSSLTCQSLFTVYRHHTRKC